MAGVQTYGREVLVYRIFELSVYGEDIALEVDFPKL